MTKTYAQVVKQIETLKLEAEKLRKQEVAGVVTRIREAIRFYDLSSADLGLGGKPKGAVKTRRTAGRKRAKGSGAPAVAKFRNEAGQTWGGIGKRPDWLRAALAAGKTLQDFAVK